MSELFSIKCAHNCEIMQQGVKRKRRFFTSWFKLTSSILSIKAYHILTEVDRIKYLIPSHSSSSLSLTFLFLWLLVLLHIILVYFLFVCLSIYMCISLSLSVFAYLCVKLFILPSVCRFVCIFLSSFLILFYLHRLAW